MCVWVCVSVREEEQDEEEKEKKNEEKVGGGRRVSPYFTMSLQGIVLSTFHLSFNTTKNIPLLLLLLLLFCILFLFFFFLLCLLFLLPSDRQTDR